MSNGIGVSYQQPALQFSSAPSESAAPGTPGHQATAYDKFLLKTGRERGHDSYNDYAAGGYANDDETSSAGRPEGTRDGGAEPPSSTGPTGDVTEGTGTIRFGGIGGAAVANSHSLVASGAGTPPSSPTGTAPARSGSRPASSGGTQQKPQPAAGNGGQQPKLGTYTPTSENAAPGNAPQVPQLSMYTPPPAGLPTATDGRPAGDTRTARQIIGQTPVLKNIGNQPGVRDGLTKQCGHWEDDPDAAYRAAEVLQYIDKSKAANGSDRGKQAGDGVIQGWVDANGFRAPVTGSEAALLNDFDKNGYARLPADQHLQAPESK